jgi:glycosyltransferase involved in cell wall biosynthesis
MHYRAPLYRLLADDPRVDFTAIYASDAGIRAADLGFGHDVMWDSDLLSGYRSIFLQDAHRTGVAGHAFSGWNWEVVQRVWSGRYDVLWVHGYYHPILQLAMLTQIATGRALLFREEQTLLERRPLWKTALKQSWLRMQLGRAKCLYIGTENRRWLERLGVPDSRLFHVPYCADNEYFQSEASRLRPMKSELRLRLGLSPQIKPVFLTAGRLVEKKQPAFLLEAFRRTRQEVECSLLIVGSGPLRRELEAQVERDNILDVVFAGFMNRSEIAHAFAAADVFVLPSGHDETWGIVVNEAMNFGLPIVTTNKVGSATDLVKRGENGYVVSSTDPQELAGRLTELAGSAERRDLMGRSSRAIIANWNHQVGFQGAISAIKAAVGSKRWEQASHSREAATSSS